LHAERRAEASRQGEIGENELVEISGRQEGAPREQMRGVGKRLRQRELPADSPRQLPAANVAEFKK